MAKTCPFKGCFCFCHFFLQPKSVIQLWYNYRHHHHQEYRPLYPKPQNTRNKDSDSFEQNDVSSIYLKLKLHTIGTMWYILSFDQFYIFSCYFDLGISVMPSIFLNFCLPRQWYLLFQVMHLRSNYHSEEMMV